MLYIINTIHAEFFHIKNNVKALINKMPMQQIFTYIHPLNFECIYTTIKFQSLDQTSEHYYYPYSETLSKHKKYII